MVKSDDKKSRQEIRWETEEDVRILERYSELLGDKERLQRARESIKERNKNINKALNIK